MATGPRAWQLQKWQTLIRDTAEQVRDLKAQAERAATAQEAKDVRTTVFRSAVELGVAREKREREALKVDLQAKMTRHDEADKSARAELLADMVRHDEADNSARAELQNGIDALEARLEELQIHSDADDENIQALGDSLTSLRKLVHSLHPTRTGAEAESSSDDEEYQLPTEARFNLRGIGVSTPVYGRDGPRRQSQIVTGTQRRKPGRNQLRF
jgi:chromosome segregation ATPase